MRRTGIVGHLRNPLIFFFFVFRILAPSIDPFLFLFIPYLFFFSFLLNAFGLGEALPFRWWFGFRQGLGAWELVYRRGKLG